MLNLKEIFSRSSIISIANSWGLVTGFVVDILIASIFGIGQSSDAFFVALTIPIIIRNVIDGTFTQVLVPQFSKHLIDKNQFDNFVSEVFWLLSTVFLAIVLLLQISSPIWGRLIAFGFDQSQINLVNQLLSPLIIMTFFMSCSGVLKAAFNSKELFFLPAIDRGVQHSVILLSMLFFQPKIGIHSVSIGYLIGAVLYTALILFVYYRLGHRIKLTRWKSETLIAFRQIGSLSFSNFVRRIYLIVERSIASTLPAGSVTALAYAFRIISAVLILTSNSMVKGLLPNLAVNSISLKLKKWRQIVNNYLFIGLAFSLPIATLVGLSGEKIANLLFGRGQVQTSDISLIGNLLLYYSPLIVIATIEQIVYAIFYARNKVNSVSIQIIFIALLNIVLSFLFATWFGIVGLVLATILSSLMSWGIALAIAALHRWVDLSPFFNSFLSLIPAFISMIAAILLISNIPFFLTLGSLSNLIKDLLNVGFVWFVGLAVYFSIGFLFPPKPMLGFGKLGSARSIHPRQI